LRCRELSKRYGEVQALRKVDFEISAGQIVGLLGENGAGKSTLIRVVAGLAEPDEGTMEVAGASFRPRHARDAQRRGVVLVPQELDLAGPMSVADNIFLGWEPRTPYGTIDVAAETAELDRLRETYAFPVPEAGRLASSLTLGEQQVVAIARALVRRPTVLLLDEPTSALSQELAATLFDIMRQLRSQAVAIAFVTHRLEELRELSDRITVMRDGEIAGAFGSDESVGTLVQAMAGETTSVADVRRMIGTTVLSQTVYRGRAIRLRPNAEPIDIDVRGGEVLGVSGLNGQGQGELLRILGGAKEAEGTLLLGDEDVTGRSVAYMIRHGVVFVPEDRHAEGLLLTRSVAENIVLPGLEKVSRWAWLRPHKEAMTSAAVLDRFHVPHVRSRDKAELLSGGTQQKIAMGKFVWLSPRVWLLADPTRGIDVTTKLDVYRFIRERIEAGSAVVVWSTDVDELVTISDRIIVLYEFRISADLSGDDLAKERVLAAMFGHG
jgi:ribose transport system ATP-binding protein